MSAQPNEVYRVLVEYLRGTGWTRQESVSGWWWKSEATEDATIGGAVEQQLDIDGLDTRLMIPGEPMEFWPADEEGELP